MYYYDDRDYFYDGDSIDELYDDEMLFEEEPNEENTYADWEYNYHDIADELVDD